MGLLFKNSLEFKKKKGFEFTSFQYLDAFLADQPSVRILVVYRPPPSGMNGFSVSLFYDEFSNLLKQLPVSPESFVILCNFHFHVDDHSGTQARRFFAVLDNFDLKQLVSIDSRAWSYLGFDYYQIDFLLRDVYMSNVSFSDHSSILFKLNHSLLPGRSP